MGKHILVADDDLHIREVISFALEKAGMQVMLAEDGRQVFCASSQAPAWELKCVKLLLHELWKLELPILHSQAGAWERAQRA